MDNVNVVAASTSTVAFVGNTEFATNGNSSLLNIPFAINSMQEFELYFGTAPFKTFAIADASSAQAADFDLGGTNYTLTQETGFYYLHSSMRYFFANGGSACYIVSTGTYDSLVTIEALQKGIDQLTSVSDASLLVVPDAMNLQPGDAYALQQYMLDHCGKTRSCFALLDIYEGWSTVSPDGTFLAVNNFRANVNSGSPDFGAAYFPWLNSTVITSSEVTYKNISNPDLLVSLLTAEIADMSFPQEEEERRMNYIHEILSGTSDPVSLDHSLRSFSEAYEIITNAVLGKMNVLSPSSAMAGIFATVDNTSGVWQAPANITVNATAFPSVKINDMTQEDLNVPVDGKAVNAIRMMGNLGIKVWGARTLNGNSDDWRYINVKRTVIMIEQSIKSALRSFMFSANDATTWSAVNSSVSNFLNSQWSSGALVGSSPAAAFSVSVGLGTTMTGEDILNGVMNVSVKIAITHPAEFLVLQFQQHMEQAS